LAQDSKTHTQDDFTLLHVHSLALSFLLREHTSELQFELITFCQCILNEMRLVRDNRQRTTPARTWRSSCTCSSSAATADSVDALAPTASVAAGFNACSVASAASRRRSSNDGAADVLSLLARATCVATEARSTAAASSVSRSWHCWRKRSCSMRARSCSARSALSCLSNSAARSIDRAATPEERPPQPQKVII
jgi:hypothetical protein